MFQTPRHKVFISFYHDDQRYKDIFVRVMGDDIVDESVGYGDINPRNMATETIRRRIRDEFIRDATVTVVLIGPCTWQRKHVDWEIASSLRDTRLNPRCGLLGIWLPNHPDHGREKYWPSRMPPRLADNVKGDDPYACLYDWPRNNRLDDVRTWIHDAFLRRRRQPDPDNSRLLFGRNWNGDCAAGWQS